VLDQQFLKIWITNQQLKKSGNHQGRRRGPPNLKKNTENAIIHHLSLKCQVRRVCNPSFKIMLALERDAKNLSELGSSVKSTFSGHTVHI
jgi:hypothetical protein